MSRIEFTKSEVKRIVKLYENLMSIANIAEEMGVSMPVIRRTLVEAGVEIRGRGRVARD